MRARGAALAAAALAGALLVPGARAIVGGEALSPEAIPTWFANIYIKNDVKKDVEGNCGGSLINDKCVLTAAHCFADKVEEGMAAGESKDKSATLTWVDWESSKFIPGGPFWTPEKQEPLKGMPRAGTGVQPREEVGGLKFAKKVAVRIGGKKVVWGTPYVHPYWFKTSSTYGRCKEYNNQKGKCREDNACRWNNDLDPPGCELQGGKISVQFNDIAVVRLDDVIKLKDQVLLAAKLPAEQKGHGAEPASTVIGQGARMSNDGEAKDRSEKEGIAWSKEQNKEENFCDKVNEEPKKGTAAGPKARKTAKCWDTTRKWCLFSRGKEQAIHNQGGPQLQRNWAWYKNLCKNRLFQIDEDGYVAGKNEDGPKVVRYAKDMAMSKKESCNNFYGTKNIPAEDWFNAPAPVPRGGFSVGGAPEQPPTELPIAPMSYEKANIGKTNSNPAVICAHHKIAKRQLRRKNKGGVGKNPNELFLPQGDCQGDSGGPLVFNKGDGTPAYQNTEQYGVVSYGSYDPTQPWNRMELSSTCGDMSQVCRCHPRNKQGNGPKWYWVPCNDPRCLNTVSHTGWVHIPSEGAYANVAYYKVWLDSLTGSEDSICGKNPLKWTPNPDPSTQGA